MPRAWEQARMTDLDGAQVPVNEYFLSHPEHVLGELRATNGAYRADDLVVTATDDTGPALDRALDALTVQARAQGLTWTARASRAEGKSRAARPWRCRPSSQTVTCRPAATAPSPGSLTGRRCRVTVPRSQAAELRQLLGSRDAVTAPARR